MSRRLSVRRESLHELGGEDLRAVAGGEVTSTCLETVKPECITGPFTMDLCPTLHCTQITT